MYWVGVPRWANVGPTEGVEPREYRVWLTPEQARPVAGVSYDEVPTHALAQEQHAPDPGRWGWKVQRTRPHRGRPGSVVGHIWDCSDAPADEDELNVFAALEVMRSTAGAVACKECGAAVALDPLL
ncbi:DUF6233 domain-containing protein [Streptomyces mirabilis]|uniref:DUF6233 domain-containing protein n=1 Tax=Streptomyces mirabilis TaxID=68239 RepID=UPI00352D810B